MILKKIILITIIILGIAKFKSQNYRITYELQGLNLKDTLYTEFNLDVLENKAFFYSQKMCTNRDINNFNIVIKSENNENTLYDKVSGINVYAKVNKKFKWEIQKETKIENNIKLQKATTIYNGKEVVAWFTTAYNINQGLYIFTGLPGIITKLEFSSTPIEFVMTSIKPIKTTCELNLENSKEINIEKYKKFTSNEDVVGDQLYKSL